MFIANALGGNSKRLEDCMLSKLLRDPPTPWEYMTIEEQKEAIRQSKAAHGFKEEEE